MLLEDLCTLEPACCLRSTTIAAAARLMLKHHTGDLVVLNDLDDERQPTGILTDRDIVVRVISADLNPNTSCVGEVMSCPLVIASAQEDTAAALERMAKHGVRRLPVTDAHGRILGVVTLDDLLREHAERTQAFLGIMTKERKREQRTAG